MAAAGTATAATGLPLPDRAALAAPATETGPR